jgi:hypothetical protein
MRAMIAPRLTIHAEISAKMSEAIAQAKRNVQNLRDREKLALQAQSEAENLRKRRQKGGAGERYHQ